MRPGQGSTAGRARTIVCTEDARGAPEPRCRGGGGPLARPALQYGAYNRGASEETSIRVQWSCRPWRSLCVPAACQACHNLEALPRRAEHFWSSRSLLVAAGVASCAAASSRRHQPGAAGRHQTAGPAQQDHSSSGTSSRHVGHSTAYAWPVRRRGTSSTLQHNRQQFKPV
jgi:hypothetical protein